MSDLIRLYRVVRSLEGKHCENEYIGDLVTCEECKWWDSDDGNIGYCHAEKHCHFSSNWEISIYRKYKADHYCSDGERRG